MEAKRCNGHLSTTERSARVLCVAGVYRQNLMLSILFSPAVTYLSLSGCTLLSAQSSCLQQMGVAHRVIFAPLRACVKVSTSFSSGLGDSTLLEDNRRAPWIFFSLAFIGDSLIYSPLCPRGDQKCSVHVLTLLSSILCKRLISNCEKLVKHRRKVLYIDPSAFISDAVVDCR